MCHFLVHPVRSNALKSLNVCIFASFPTILSTHGVHRTLGSFSRWNFHLAADADVVYTCLETQIFRILHKRRGLTDFHLHRGRGLNPRRTGSQRAIAVSRLAWGLPAWFRADHSSYPCMLCSWTWSMQLTNNWLIDGCSFELCVATH